MLLLITLVLKVSNAQLCFLYSISMRLIQRKIFKISSFARWQLVYCDIRQCSFLVRLSSFQFKPGHNTICSNLIQQLEHEIWKLIIFKTACICKWHYIVLLFLDNYYFCSGTLNQTTLIPYFLHNFLFF